TTALIAPPPAAITTAASAARSASATACLAGRALFGRVARSLRLRVASHGRLDAGRRSRTCVVDLWRFLVVVVFSHHQNYSPPSRAASASALTRPWNR